MMTDEEVALLIAKAGGPDQVRRILRGELEIELLPVSRGLASSAPITVPAGVAFEKRIERGHYGWRHVGLTEQLFPVDPDQSGEHELRVFHFARSISSEDAIREIRAAGFEPARTGAILIFGESHPEEQRKFPVVALGSVAVVDSKSSVPALWFDGACRTLDLIWFEGDWHRNYRFLGVRRLPQRSE